jgi:hypothetical protein
MLESTCPLPSLLVSTPIFSSSPLADLSKTAAVSAQVLPEWTDRSLGLCSSYPEESVTEPRSAGKGAFLLEFGPHNGPCFAPQW